MLDRTVQPVVSSKNMPPPEPEDLSEVEKKIAIRKAIRKDRLEAAQDYTSFGASKICGTGLITTGAFETVAPDVIAAVIQQPVAVAGIGLCLLGGKRVVDLLDKALKGFREDD